MEVSRINRSLIKPVITTAAIIGIIQALIWTGLSLVSILFYHSVILIDDTLPTNSYPFIIYNLFLNADIDITDERVIVTTEVFSIFMYIYLGLSFLWLIMSLYMLWVIKRNKLKDGYRLLSGWSGITLIISILDIILMSLIAVDFITIQDDSSTATPSTPTITTTISSTADPNIHITYTSYGIIMTLAARGYILWIVNIIFAIILIKFAYTIKKEATPSLLPIIDAYRTSGRPWTNLYEETDIGNAYSNGGFRDENDRSIFPRSDSFINKNSEVRNKNPLSNGANPYDEIIENIQPSLPNPNVSNGRVAKIGKKGGRRTPPQNIPPPNVPYIPDPDYTPPSSPRSKPKSVLRPKSNYVL